MSLNDHNNETNLILSRKTVFFKYLQVSHVRKAPLALAAALGALSIVSSAGLVVLPQALQLIAAGIGIEGLGSILDRLAGDNAVSEDEIHNKITDAIKVSGIEEALKSVENQQAIGRLFQQLEFIKDHGDAQKDEIILALHEQSSKYEYVFYAIRDELSKHHDLLIRIYQNTAHNEYHPMITLWNRIDTWDGNDFSMLKDDTGLLLHISRGNEPNYAIRQHIYAYIGQAQEELKANNFENALKEINYILVGGGNQ